jgi:hypothetical protein
MERVRVFVEAGKRRTFAGAVDWPGWCRSGRDEAAALQALLGYGPRYGRVLKGSGLGFEAPGGAASFDIIERVEGDATTDFGAPGAILAADRAAMAGAELERQERILCSCWRAFDDAVRWATGLELRKGPRGGGRDLEKIVEHVIEAERSYLGRLAWKQKRGSGDQGERLAEVRRAVEAALRVAVEEGLPEKGPRGGVIWPVRYFVRRAAWHVLDHAWEIEDRAE